MIMTYNDFHFLEKNVVDILNDMLDQVMKTSFEDFVLLLIRADYDETIASHPLCNLSPYVIEDPKDDYMDISRLNFLETYIKDYCLRLKNNDTSVVNLSDFELNIQMMMYAHAWESHLFLKLLERIALILNGKRYRWHSMIGSTSKHTFISQNIIAKLKKVNSQLGTCVELCYNSKLRNDFAHSTYYIDDEEKMIYSCSSGFMCGDYKKPFSEWERMFVYTILLSYHLGYGMRKLKNNFINNFGDSPVLLKRPLMANPQKYQTFWVKPQVYTAGNCEHVRFHLLTK